MLRSAGAALHFERTACLPPSSAVSAGFGERAVPAFSASFNILILLKKTDSYPVLCDMGKWRVPSGRVPFSKSRAGREGFRFEASGVERNETRARRRLPGAAAICLRRQASFSGVKSAKKKRAWSLGHAAS